MFLLDKFIILFEAHVNQTGFTKLNKNLKTATKDMQRAKVQASSLMGAKGIFSAKNLFRGFVGYDLYSVVRDLPQQFIDATTKLGAMQSRFRAVSDSAEEGGNQLRWVSEQSRRLGLDLYNTADNYSIFYATVKKTLGGDTAQDIFGKWMEAFRVLHIPVEQQSRVLYALREMSSKGKIYMQDLAMQLGSAVPATMPIATQAMGFGTDTEAFRKAIQDGQVDVNKFLKVFTDAIHEQYAGANAVAKAMQAPDAQIQRMTANWQQLLISFAEAGVSKDLVAVLSQVNKVLDFANKYSKEIYQTLRLIGTLALWFFMAKGANKAWGGLKAIITGIAGVFKNLAITISAIWAYIKDIKVLGVFIRGSLGGIFRGMSALLGGPLGATIMALGTIDTLLKIFFPKYLDQLWAQLDFMFTSMVMRIKALWYEMKTGQSAFVNDADNIVPPKSIKTITGMAINPSSNLFYQSANMGKALANAVANSLGNNNKPTDVKINNVQIDVTNGNDPKLILESVSDGISKAITSNMKKQSSTRGALVPKPLTSALGG